MSIDYKPHLLEWTDEKVARFWNFRNNYKPYDDTWFTLQAGNAVLKLVNKHYPLHGKILDYGTGKGYLIEKLLENYSSAELYACDFTDSLVPEVERRFKNKVQFKGCQLLTTLPSAYADAYFDVVFLIETIEHLTDTYLHGTLREISRILKPGGIIVITTPNEEPIEKTFVHCADCGASFHHMQHIRSWSVKTILALASEFEYKTVFCQAVNIQWYNARGFIYYAADQVKRLFGKPAKANLVYIGKKVV